jgi:hypothetical protein
MSKKQLLNESEIRRFMKLANLEPLTKAVVTEMAAVNQIPQDTRRPETGMQQEMMGKEDEAKGLSMEAEDAMEVEVGDEADPEKQSAFEAAVKALADAMGIEVELEGQEEHAEEAGEEMHDLDMGGEEGGEESEEEAGKEEAGEEEMDEAKKAKKEEGEEELDETKKEEEEEVEESKALSEDSLVEAVLARVTARLVAEAKKKKMSAKEKMKMKAKEKKAEKKEVVEEATDSKGGGPLLSKGGNKHDVWKGHADMAYAKGKEGKGGHQMEDLPAKAEHTVTHGGKNLATLGGNKKKV